ncbi:transposase family protein [Bifidobacterium longum]|uniref:transposase family protein n=2 Tax=Bifidobacterium longum TaxID=216816 RepID=UPI003A40FFEE
MNSIFNQLLNVKNTVVEDACIVDSPLRSEPVLEVRVRPRAGACSDAPAAGGGAAGMTRAAACGAGVARISAAGGVKLVAAMPRVDCPKCGVVVARVPWAEPGSRFTKDFEAECAWLMTVANQRTVSGSLHVSWDRRRRRPSGRGTRQGVDALAVRRTARDRRGRDQPQEGPHVPDRGRRP